MLVKIPDFPDDLAAALRAETGMSTSSKAVLTVAREHLDLVAMNRALELRVLKLHEQLQVSLATIEAARSAAAALLDRTSQQALDV